MSVWSDMGVGDGRMNGVEPGAFLNAAYAFFGEVRKHVWPDRTSAWLPDWGFSLRRKAGERERRNWNDWVLLGRYLSFPAETEALGRPIPETFWNSLPGWNGIFAQTEETLLGGETVPCPYGSSPMRAEIMDPAWPLQRYGIIRKMRYMTVPLNIRTKVYDPYTGSVYWTDHYSESYQYGYLNTGGFYWNGLDDGGRYICIEAQLPEYWAQGSTVCRIAFEGGWADPGSTYPPPPVDGCGWHDGDRYFSGEYTGQFSSRGVLRLFGAADLSTHPDFARYFDPNE